MHFFYLKKLWYHGLTIMMGDVPPREPMQRNQPPRLWKKNWIWKVAAPTICCLTTHCWPAYCHSRFRHCHCRQFSHDDRGHSRFPSCCPIQVFCLCFRVTITLHCNETPFDGVIPPVCSLWRSSIAVWISWGSYGSHASSSCKLSPLPLPLVAMSYLQSSCCLPSKLFFDNKSMLIDIGPTNY